MKCKICSKKGSKYVKINNGTICPKCYEKIPSVVRANVSDLTTRQIISSCSIIKKVEYDRKVFWGDLGIKILFSDNGILVDGIEDVYMSAIFTDPSFIKFEDIKNVELNFHPTDINSSKPNCLNGEITLIINTKKPHLVIEIPIIDIDYTYSTLSYVIHGKDITYRYPEDMMRIVTAMETVINEKEENLQFFKREYLKIRNEQAAEKKAKEQAREEAYERDCAEYDEMERREREANQKAKMGQRSSYADDPEYMSEKRKREESRKKAEEEERKKTQEREEKSKREKRKRNSNRNEELSDFEKAMKMFGVQIPYTQDEIKRKRNELIKKVHPDEGGTNESAALINEYYKLLSKFVV